MAELENSYSVKQNDVDSSKSSHKKTLSLQIARQSDIFLNLQIELNSKQRNCCACGLKQAGQSSPAENLPAGVLDQKLRIKDETQGDRAKATETSGNLENSESSGRKDGVEIDCECKSMKHSWNWNQVGSGRHRNCIEGISHNVSVFKIWVDLSNSLKL